MRTVDTEIIKILREIKNALTGGGGGSDSSQDLEDYVKKSDLYLTFECTADNVLNWYDDGGNATSDANEAASGRWAFPLSKERFENALTIKAIVNPISESFITRYSREEQGCFVDVSGWVKIFWTTGEDYNNSYLVGQASNELPSDFEGIIIQAIFKQGGGK